MLNLEKKFIWNKNKIVSRMGVSGIDDLVLDDVKKVILVYKKVVPTLVGPAYRKMHQLGANCEVIYKSKTIGRQKIVAVVSIKSVLVPLVGAPSGDIERYFGSAEGYYFTVATNYVTENSVYPILELTPSNKFTREFLAYVKMWDAPFTSKTIRTYFKMTKIWEYYGLKGV